MLTKLQGDRYQVVQVLSQGIFCQTYLVQDTHLLDHPTCVVKHFLPSSQNPIPIDIRRRLFTREVEALKKLNNYDLVPHLLAHFEDNLEFYLVQEFIEGHPLSAELSPGHCWSESKVFQLLHEILTILNFVHDHGLIHRDVKPSNIIRRKQDNRLVLIDFGAVKPIWNQLIKSQGKNSNFIPIEYTTIAIGTPGYMPHEQERGKPRPNSDIYALGIIAIQALTGVHPTKLPEDGNTGEIIWQHLVQVNPGLASVLNKMVRYHFKDRYNSAQEALEALSPLTHFYTSTQELASTLIVANHTFEFQLSPPDTLLPLTDIHTLPEKFASPPAANDRTISIFPNKLALLIGLILGVGSGLILMVVSYWSVQIVAPDPKVQQNSLPQHRGISR
ncbi:serine/threonine protein kinase [Nostocales cyanobacterium HT-58-2]|nr:serine/threonine protein kinase [Nostocales cyanobacterium HT-58-2]